MFPARLQSNSDKNRVQARLISCFVLILPGISGFDSWTPATKDRHAVSLDIDAKRSLCVDSLQKAISHLKKNLPTWQSDLVNSCDVAQYLTSCKNFSLPSLYTLWRIPLYCKGTQPVYEVAEPAGKIGIGPARIHDIGVLASRRGIHCQNMKSPGETGILRHLLHNIMTQKASRPNGEGYRGQALT
jgi:hypothetical protein